MVGKIILFILITRSILPSSFHFWSPYSYSLPYSSPVGVMLKLGSISRWLIQPQPADSHIFLNITTIKSKIFSLNRHVDTYFVIIT